MQTQAPGYSPNRKANGVKKGLKQVRTDGKPPLKGRSPKINRQVRKASPYSKKRGMKSTDIANGYKGMTMNQPLQHQQVASNNLPGMNFPGAAPLV